MNGSENDRRLTPFHRPPLDQAGVAGSAVLAMFMALIGGSATAAADEIHSVQAIGAGRSFVDVAPGDAWQPDGYPGELLVRAAAVSREPTIDGRVDDPAWEEAVATTVPLAWGRIREATLKAVYTEEEIFIAVSWADPTRDDQHHPWVWNAAQGRYVESPQVEDSLLVSFEAGCDWNPSLLANHVYDFDIWVWMAARSNPLGQAVDSVGNVQNVWEPERGYTGYRTRYPDPTWILKFTDRRDDILTESWRDLERMYKIVPPAQEVYVKYPPDGGPRAPMYVERIGPPASPPARAMNAGLGSDPAAEQAIAPQYRPVKLTGEAGEVTAKGQWSKGRWTVEFRRVLVTPARGSNDAVFERTNQFSIHILDRTERLDQASESGRLLLEFEPAGADQLDNDTVLATR